MFSTPVSSCFIDVICSADDDCETVTGACCDWFD